MVHLHSSKHGVYTCPVETCGKSLCVWRPEFSQHEHTPDIHVKSHLAGKTFVEDFLVTYKDDEVHRMFPNNFRDCEACGVVLDPVDADQHLEHECPLRTKFPALNVRETLVDPTLPHPRNVFRLKTKGMLRLAVDAKLEYTSKPEAPTA